MTTFNNAIATLTSSMTENAWTQYNLTWEEIQDFDAMVNEIDDAHLLEACEWLVTDWEENDTELEEMYNMTLQDGMIGYEEAWEYKLTVEELELYNSNPDLQVAEESLPSEMTVGEALMLDNQADDNSHGNVILPTFWAQDYEMLTARLCKWEDLSSCMNVVVVKKEREVLMT
jgi:hypothetical protein